MARQKKPVHRVQMTEGKRNIIHQLLEEYDIQSAEDIQDALKDLLNNPVPVSLLSGDRKPQIRFLGNHHSSSGNLYHKSFRM